MTKTDFFEVLTKKVQAAMGPDYEVKVLPVRKNNDTVLNGMTILSAESNVSPTIYLDDFWMKYCSEQRTIGEIVDEIIECYNQHKDGCSIDVEWIRDYSKAKDKVIAVLVNKSKNAELLENVAHKEHLDLAIVYKLLVDIAKDGSTGTITVTSQMMKIWGITIDELDADAKANTPSLCPLKAQGMFEVLTSIMGDDEVTEIMPVAPDCGMTVVSNEKTVNGAIAIFYDGVLEKISNSMGSSLFILPSSIHEVIVIPADTERTIDEQMECLNNMVQEVNATQVAPDEVLADHAYFYCKESKEVKYCA